MLFSGKWPIAGVSVAGMAIVLIGIRVLAGANFGGEFWMWAAAIGAIAAVAAAIAASIPH